MTATQPAPRRNRRPKKRELFCPAHPEQRIQGNGKKYYLHLLQPEQLEQARGVFGRQIRDPAREGRVARLHRHQHHPIERNEHR